MVVYTPERDEKVNSQLSIPALSEYAEIQDYVNEFEQKKILYLTIFLSLAILLLVAVGM